MWRLVLILAFFSCCKTAPQQPGSLEDLINGVFSKPPRPTSPTLPAQPVTRAPEKSMQLQPIDDLDDLIADVFRTGNKSTPTPIPINTSTTLGSKNTEATNDNCECVPYYQCHQGSILDNGVGLIDIRVQGPCDNYLDVCCDPPNVRKPEDKVTPPPRIRTGCGKRNPEGVGFRITGQTDSEAQFGEFPWMVAILKEEIIGSTNGETSKLNVYQCGGALIHTRVVLTAAHCVNGKKPSELRVRAGEWDTQTKNEIFPHQDRFVENIIVHENFHSGALRNDIALLILSQPVELAENVDIVCLPEAGTNFDGARCVASGWGKDVFGKEGHYQVILKRVELPMVPHPVCENSLRKTRLGKYFVLDRSFVCAGGEPGKDTCKGDGGSPLVCPLPNDRNRYVQAGIVAWGIGCGDQTPGVYANVAHARRWIDEQMAFNNLDTTVYQYHP